MDTDAGPRVSELHPRAAWDLLKTQPEAVLVDVRSKPEWVFVGKPDLSALGRSAIFVEWASFPKMSANTRFVEEVLAELAGTCPPAMLFLCRSGVRSLGAAKAMKLAFVEEGSDVDCINVAEGFEGDIDEQKKRGTFNGWKVRGLPWVQS